MKRNIYYRSGFGRQNNIKVGILGFALAFCSYPRMLIEVFIRKDFGERYFSFSTLVIFAVLLFIAPLPFLARIEKPFQFFLFHFVTWYAFVFYFVYTGWQHKKTLKRSPSVFDFARYSGSSGSIHPKFYAFKYRDKSFDIRQIECYLEPLLFLLIGSGLLLLTQFIGAVFIVCSIIYGLSYMGDYYVGDIFIMGLIDEMICNEAFEKTFVQDKDEDVRGFRSRFKRPTTEELRKQVLGQIITTDDEFVEVR